MDERVLFNRFHEAFEIQPRPGSYDRMRAALIGPSVVVKRRGGFRLRFTRMGLRAAAAMALVVLIVAAFAGFLALHRASRSTYVPARPHGENLKPYQDLFARNHAQAYIWEANHCFLITDAGCPASVERYNAVLEAWLQDMDGITPPARFTRIDAMLRAHLAAAIAAGNVAVQAQKTGNAGLFNAATAEYLDLRGFYAQVSDAVAAPREVTAAGYRANLSDQMDLFNSCTPCARYVTSAPPACTGSHVNDCIVDAVAVDAQIYTIEAAVVAHAAPNSIGADATLQTDLANADAAALEMIHAGLGGDVSGFNSAQRSLQVAISAFTADATAIQSG
jgi:hypothetical protein